MPNNISETILDPMLGSTSEELNKNLQGDIEYLRQSAQDFLKGIQTVLDNNNHIEKMLKLNKNSLLDVYNQMKNSTSITRACIQHQYTFENKLNAFLGRTILLVYVTKGGDILYADEAEAQNIYQRAYRNKDKKGVGSGRGGGIKLTRSIMDKLTNTPPEIVNIYKETLDYKQGFYRGIRDEVLERWTNNHLDLNNWVKTNSKLLNTFYWMINPNAKEGKNKWDWSSQINRGHINETYIALIWEKKELDESFKDKTKVEENVKKYWDYMKAHNLNSRSGIQGGDVTFFLNDSIQLAVKSGTFNTAAIGTYLQVANQIVNNKLIIDKNAVKDLLQNLNKYVSSVENYIQENLLQKEIKNIVTSTGGILS